MIDFHGLIIFADYPLPPIHISFMSELLRGKGLELTSIVGLEVAGDEG